MNKYIKHSVFWLKNNNNNNNKKRPRIIYYYQKKISKFLLPEQTLNFTLLKNIGQLTHKVQVFLLIV